MYRVWLISKVLNICLQFLFDSIDDSENTIWGSAWETEGHIIRDSYLDKSDRINWWLYTDRNLNFVINNLTNYKKKN